MKASLPTSRVTKQFARPRFSVGQGVVLTDIATGRALLVSRVAQVMPHERQLSIEGYTARFDLDDGRGLPLIETETRGSCPVYDINGRLLKEATEESVLVRHLPARYNLRPATGIELRDLAGAAPAIPARSNPYLSAIQRARQIAHVLQNKDMSGLRLVGSE